MLQKIRNLVAINNLIPKNSNVIIGLSGGPDSVFLLHFLASYLEAGNIKKLIAVHLDHEWRSDSYEDIEFCREITKKYNAHLVTAKFSDLSISLKFNGSKEEIGRRARRFFFEKIKKEYQADLIALAHHAQDQQETFFIRLMRGATLAGLTCMKLKDGAYVRPLLYTNKKEILSFLDQHNIPYLVDKTNNSDQFLRNRIRKTILPAARTCDQRFDGKFAQTLDHLQKTEFFLEEITQKAFNKIATYEGNSYSINIADFMKLHEQLYHRVLLYWLCQEKVPFPVSTSFFNEIMRFLQQRNGGTHQLHRSWNISKKKGIAYLNLKSISCQKDKV